MKSPKWVIDNGASAKHNLLIEVEVKHCNSKLNLKNVFLKGCFKDDGFYLDDGGELSFNWNIVKWRKVSR